MNEDDSSAARPAGGGDANDAGGDDNNNNSKQCFSLLSSRRLFVGAGGGGGARGDDASPTTTTTSTFRLCPSMDLMCFGYKNMLWLHRSTTTTTTTTTTTNHNNNSSRSTTAAVSSTLASASAGINTTSAAGATNSSSHHPQPQQPQQQQSSSGGGAILINSKLASVPLTLVSSSSSAIRTATTSSSSSSDNNNKGGNNGDGTTVVVTSLQAVAWRPDGRVLATVIVGGSATVAGNKNKNNVLDGVATSRKKQHEYDDHSNENKDDEEEDVDDYYGEKKKPSAAAAVPPPVPPTCLELSLYHVEQMMLEQSSSSSSAATPPSSSSFAAGVAATGTGDVDDATTEEGFDGGGGPGGRIVSLSLRVMGHNKNRSRMRPPTEVSERRRRRQQQQKGRTEERTSFHADDAATTDPIVSALSAVGMTWAIAGKPHPSWERRDNDSDDDDDDEYEYEEALSWTYQRRHHYVDREEENMLFQCAAGDDNAAVDATTTSAAGEDGVSTTASVLPASKTPLTVLGIVTKKSFCDDTIRQQQHQHELSLNLFLHGRFAILEDWPLPAAEKMAAGPATADAVSCTEAEIVISTNLTHFAVLPDSNASTAVLHLVSIPPLRNCRYKFQILTSLSCRIRSQLKHIARKGRDVAASYRSSLKPLDLKLEILDKLIRSYSDGNTSDQTTSSSSEMHGVLLQYVTSGMTSSSTSRSVAVDNILQAFFCNVQMNDQLLVRLERSLTTAVANVETQLRCLLDPARHVVSQTAELLALAESVDYSCGGTSSKKNAQEEEAAVLLCVIPARNLYDHASTLLLELERALSVLVKFRFALRDGVAWLRHAGAQVRAHSAGPTSAQAEAARKKRVPDALIHRVVGYWQDAVSTSVARIPTPSRTERFLGIRFYALFNDDESMSLPSANTTLKSLDSNVSSKNQSAATADYEKKLCPLVLRTTIPNISMQTLLALDGLLERPRAFVRESVRELQLLLPYSLNDESATISNRCCRALTTRVGQGGVNPRAYFGEKADGFFSPKEIRGLQDGSDVYLNREAQKHREWIVVAEASTLCSQSIDGNVCNNVVLLHALPLSWSPRCDDDDDDDDDGERDRNVVTATPAAARGILASKNCWTATLRLPENCSVRDLAFYGDDGKSSLSGDGGTGKEGRQALGLIVERRRLMTVFTELWILRYDKCAFSSRELRRFDDTVPCRIGIPDVPPSRSQLTTVRPLPEDGEGVDEGQDEETGDVPTSILYAKTRTISTVSESVAAAAAASDDSAGSNITKDSKLVVSGSRGIGAVLTTATASSATAETVSTFLDMLDLEEDEEEEDEDVDDDEMSTS